MNFGVGEKGPPCASPVPSDTESMVALMTLEVASLRFTVMLCSPGGSSGYVKAMEPRVCSVMAAWALPTNNVAGGDNWNPEFGIPGVNIHSITPTT